MSSQLTVYYNTKCPVCNAGIDWQRSRLVEAARAGIIEFRDINLEPDALSRFGTGLEDVRRRLHAVDADGRLYVGADCAIAVWRLTPGDAWLGAARRPAARSSRSHAPSMTVSPICSTPGTAARAIGDVVRRRVAATGLHVARRRAMDIVR